MSYMRTRPGTRHYVYRFYSAEGDLLYIGATSNLHRRMSIDRDYTKRVDVAQWFAVEYPTRAEAFAAEREAIRREHPIWNVTGNSRGVSA